MKERCEVYIIILYEDYTMSVDADEINLLKKKISELENDVIVFEKRRINEAKPGDSSG